MSDPWALKKVTEWKTSKLPDGQEIQVSNPHVVQIPGLSLYPNLLLESEASAVLRELDLESWTVEGYAQKRKVQRFRMNEDRLPQTLELLNEKFKQQTGLIPKEIVAIELAHAHDSTNVSSFESLESPPPQDDSYFVANVVLLNSAMAHLNRPAARGTWELYSPNHCTALRMPMGQLFCKRGAVLWDWRSFLTPEWTGKAERLVLLKFVHLPSPPPSSSPVHFPSNGERITTEMPPLKDILTILVTTSPIKSHPSTELLERTFETFSLGGQEFMECQKVIICDGVRIREEETQPVTKKHGSAKQALRNGIASREQADNYNAFKHNLQTLCEADAAPFIHTRVVELETRHGYGFALRHGLQHCVQTPFVCVIQHDRTFMRTTPIEETVHAMWRNKLIKYVGFTMRSNLIYRDIFQSKYGKVAHDELGTMVLRPPELSVNSSRYGPNSESLQSIIVPPGKLRDNLDSVRDQYMNTIQNLSQDEWLTESPPPPAKHQMSLTPTIFWYDNTHIVETAHYRDFIFNPSYKMVARGGFVEDKTSPVIAKAVERHGLKKGHNQFGSYLMDDHSGYFFTGHLDGGSYMPREEKERRFAPTKAAPTSN